MDHALLLYLNPYLELAVSKGLHAVTGALNSEYGGDTSGRKNSWPTWRATTDLNYQLVPARWAMSCCSCW